MKKYCLEFNAYTNGRVAIQVFDNEGPYARLSVNMEEVPLKDNEFIVNHDLMHPMFEEFRKEMLENYELEDTGKTCDFGFCRDIPIWRIK